MGSDKRAFKGRSLTATANASFPRSSFLVKHRHSHRTTEESWILKRKSEANANARLKDQSCCVLEINAAEAIGGTPNRSELESEALVTRSAKHP